MPGPFLAALIRLHPVLRRGWASAFYPNMVPPDLTIWEAAAPDESLIFLLVGALVLVPLILAYTAYAYCGLPGQGRSGTRISLMQDENARQARRDPRAALEAARAGSQFPLVFRVGFVTLTIVAMIIRAFIA